MPSEVKWIKIVTDIFDDEKILLIESMPDCDSIIVIWFKLLCLAGKQNNGGVFMMNERIPYTDEMFATIFRRPVNTVRLALKTFEEYGMIEIINNTVTIPKWELHQSLEKIEKGREQARKRMASMRERQRQLALSEETKSGCSEYVTPMLRVTDGEQLRNVTPIEREGEREGDNIIMGDKSPKKAPKRFVPPSVDEVRAYCQERGNNVDAERFVDYYTSNGWHVGKNPMKDWRAAVRTWERHGWNGYGYGGKPQKPAGADSSIDMAEVEQIMNPMEQKPRYAKTGERIDTASFDLADFRKLANKFD